MASATLLTGVATPPTTHRPWPADARSRWGLRLALALPLVGLALWADGRGFESGAHRTLTAQAAAVRAGGSDLAGLGAAYPPLPTLLAGLVPGGSLGLSVVAGLCAGCTLQLVWEQLVRRGMPAVLTGCLLLPLVAVPAVAYAASRSVAEIVLLSLLAVAVHGFIRFTAERDPGAAFLAGLALAAACTVDPIAFIYALLLGVAGGFLARGRADGCATVMVIVFPTAFTALSWMFLEWWFTGAVGLGVRVLSFPAAVTTVGAALLHVPLFVAVGAAHAARRPVALVGYLTVVPASVVAVWTGLPYPPVTVYVLFTLVALLSVPRDAGRRTGAALGGVALVQLVLAWVWPPAGPDFAQWLAAVT